MKLLAYNRTGPTIMTVPYGRQTGDPKRRYLGTNPIQNHEFACHNGKFDPKCAACQELKRKAKP